MARPKTITTEPNTNIKEIIQEEPVSLPDVTPVIEEDIIEIPVEPIQEHHVDVSAIEIDKLWQAKIDTMPPVKKASLSLNAINYVLKHL